MVIRLKELLCEAVTNIDDDKALIIASKMIEEGISSIEIINAVQEGLVNVGNMFEKGEYYIADLMMVGVLFKEILKLEGMKLDNLSSKDNSAGLILIATMKGDIHDIGKDIFYGLASGAGFRVIDLGVDVDTEDIINSVRKYKPEILALSGVMSYTVCEAKKIVLALEENNLRDTLKIIVGGAAFSSVSNSEIKADAITYDAFEGINICKEWMRENN